MALNDKEKKSTECCIGIWAVGLTLAIVWMMSVYVGYSIITNYYSEQCIISGVITATEIPRSNNTDNWVDCNCGKRCVTKTPCEQLIVDIPNGDSGVTAQKHSISERSDGSKCTNREDYCPNEWDTNGRMVTSQNNVQKYIDMMNNNETIKCYVNNDRTVAVLNNDINMAAVIGSAVLVGVCGMCLLGWCYSYNHVEKSKDKTVDEDEKKCSWFSNKRCILPCHNKDIEDV